MQVVTLCNPSDESKLKSNAYRIDLLGGEHLVHAAHLHGDWAGQAETLDSCQPEKVTSDAQLVDHLQHKSGLSQSDQRFTVSETDHSYVADLLVS